MPSARNEVDAPSVEFQPPHLDRVAVLLEENVDGHAEVLDRAPVLANVPGAWLARPGDGGAARGAHDVLAGLVGVEVNFNVRVLPDVPRLHTRLGLNKEGLAVPEVPDGDRLRGLVR